MYVVTEASTIIIIIDVSVQVAVGYSHMVAVTVNLTVFSWGDNSRGQLGHGDTQLRTQPVLIESLNDKNIKR